jgi:hypothetical protein
MRPDPFVVILVVSRKDAAAGICGITVNFVRIGPTTNRREIRVAAKHNSRSEPGYTKTPMRITRKRLLLPTLLIAIWLSTLGVFIDTMSSSALSSPISMQGIPDGKVSFRAYIGQSDAFSRGVPYLFQFTADRTPYPLIIVISADDSTNVVELNLTGVYTEGENETNRLDGSRVIQNGHRFKLSKGNEESVYFSESIPAAIWSDRPTKVRVMGEAIKESGDKVPFDLTLDVPFEREQEIYCGWMKLLYYDQF